MVRLSAMTRWSRAAFSAPRARSKRACSRAMRALSHVVDLRGHASRLVKRQQSLDWLVLQKWPREAGPESTFGVGKGIEKRRHGSCQAQRFFASAKPGPAGCGGGLLLQGRGLRWTASLSANRIPPEAHSKHGQAWRPLSVAVLGRARSIQGLVKAQTSFKALGEVQFHQGDAQLLLDARDEVELLFAHQCIQGQRRGATSCQQSSQLEGEVGADSGWTGAAGQGGIGKKWFTWGGVPRLPVEWRPCRAAPRPCSHPVSGSGSRLRYMDRPAPFYRGCARSPRGRFDV